jgi:hypothetical protein
VHINGQTVPSLSFSDGSSYNIAVNVSAFSVAEDWFAGQRAPMSAVVEDLYACYRYNAFD